MENYRNKGRKILKIKREFLKKKGSFLLYGVLLGIFLSVFSLILYLLLPAFITSNYYQKSLNPLRKQARAIKNEFDSLISVIKQKQSIVSSSSFPAERNEIFSLFKEINLDTDREGIAYYNQHGELILWLGNVIDLETYPLEVITKNFLEREKSSFLIKNRDSDYLVSSQKVNEKGYVVFNKLLAFDPQFKTRYLKEYQFLRPKLIKNLQSILYYDLHDDVSGFERFFSRHEDEYISQPALQDKTQTLFFPLRNEANRIMALVTLSPPSLASFVSTQKENILLAFYILFGIALVFFLVFLVKTTSFFRKGRLLPLALFILTLIGFRLIFLPFSHLERIKTSPLFSPSLASFLPFTNLTKSPADIFFTFFFLFLIITSLVICLGNYYKQKKIKNSSTLSLPLNFIFILFSVVLSIIFQNILKLFIFNSNINLLRFSFNPPFLLLHLGILCFFLSFLLTIFMGLKIAALYSSHFLISLLIFILGFGGFSLLFKESYSLLIILLQTIVVFSILTLAYFPSILKRKVIFVSAFLISTLFLYISLHLYSSQRCHSLFENSLKNIVISQEHWGNFLLAQSLAEIEERKESIFSFFENPESLDLTQSLWRKTSIAKFNWYSSLEIWSPDGEILNRFSLNFPELYPLDFKFPIKQDWSILHQSILFMGKEKNCLVAYKDWFRQENYLGRTLFTISVDYDMLPFLYTASPYFEIIRVTSLHSLNQLDFGFAVFDLEGTLIFNPNKISSGIRPSLLEKILASTDSIWSSFTDKNKKYKSFYFKTNSRVYSFFMPKKNFINYSVEFLKLLFFYIVIFFFSSFLINIIFEKKKWKNPLWSFSNKVYASFMAVAIILLLLFTFFTRNFLERIFAQQSIEKAEIQTSVAHRVMEYFIFLQQAEKYTPVAPPEDLVLWISSTISNDVNLYQEGRLIASSRREFYDHGLLPELIDGEIYYQIQFENNPFYTRNQKIGDYSFHTLTIPFFYLDSFLLISLPFPFEQQEISKATEDFIEFLVFISVFFVIIVLLYARGMGALIVTPIKKLLAGTKQVSLGNLEVSIEHKPQDEMRTLIDGFNAMIKNLKKHQQDLTEMSKKVAWAEMARKVAHEIKNPLTPIQLSAEHLLRVHSDKKGDFDHILKESVSYIIKEVENLRKIAREFLDISKEKTLHKELFDLKEAIQESVSPYKKTLSERIKFRETYEGEDFSFEGDKDKLRIALRNIFINAVEATRERGEIEVLLKREKDKLLLEIKDTGLGMEKAMLEKVFEPYFSTKDVGTGLGLSIAKKIIEDHGGTIQISSTLRKGTKISIEFPVT